jgi:hypothetical protein
MRRRFGRRRWGGGGNDDGGSRGLDVAQELARVLRLGLVDAEALEPAGGDDVPATLAVVGTGTARDGEELVVGVARNGGDAWLAAIAVATRLAASEGFSGTALAIAPSWPLAARRRLGLLRSTPFRVRARIEQAPGQAEGGVEPEPLEASLLGAAAAGAGGDRARRALYERCAAALVGLAAKHDGAVRSTPNGDELMLLGRIAAVLRGDESGIALEVREPRREMLRLVADGLPDAFDRLEGSLRKFLGDRRMREGDAASRFVLASALLAHLDLRNAVLWPLSDPLGEAIDFAGLDAEGRPVAGVARAELNLAALGPVLDAWVALVPRLPAILASSRAGRGLARPELVVATERLDAPAARVLACIDADLRSLAASRRGSEPSFVAREVPALDAAAPSRRMPAFSPPSPPAEPAARSDRFERGAPVERAEPVEARPFVAPRRRSSAPAREPEPSEPVAETQVPPVESGSGEAVPRRRFEELSVFDLGESGANDDAAQADGPRRRRRRRGRGRGRGPGSAAGASASGDGGDSEDEEEPEALPAPVESSESFARPERPERPERGERGGRGRGRGGRERGAPRPPVVEVAEEREDDEEGGELDESMTQLAEVPELEVPEPVYEEEEGEEGEPESEEDRLMRREREQRRRARLAKGDPEPEQPRPPPRPPRRRAAVLAHADRESVAAAVLLARELRLIDAIWIYPQAELMTFFRNVATDLRDDTPIVVVGFTASPARETLQTASLYRDRLVWYDHHEWPPEDLEGLRAAIGADSVHVDAAAGSALAVVLAGCTRRSRFSDKLVDLLTGRFSTHDYARWGRLWWSRLAQLAAKPGERRQELEALLVGRPSDLARQAARVAPPPLPTELEWVAARDFRIVHFGGHALVRVPLPPEQDLHLAARVVRDRYRAPLSLAWTEGTDRFVLASDEGASRRVLDLGSMVEHLGEKFAWVTALPDPDHVARFRIEGAATHPERIDEVVAEIAMGRSLLEG